MPSIPLHRLRKCNPPLFCLYRLPFNIPLQNKVCDINSIHFDTMLSFLLFHDFAQFMQVAFCFFGIRIQYIKSL